MPWPGTKSSRAAMSASWPSPRARSASMTCSLVIPGGSPRPSSRPSAPANTTLVASPRIRGPITLNTTDTTVAAMTTEISTRSGRSIRSSRRSDGPKLMAFSAARMPPRGPWPVVRGASLSRSAALVIFSSGRTSTEIVSRRTPDAAGAAGGAWTAGDGVACDGGSAGSSQRGGVSADRAGT